MIAYILNAYQATAVSPYTLTRPIVVGLAAVGVATILAAIVMRSLRRGAVVVTAVTVFVVLGRDPSSIVGNVIGNLPGWQVAILAGLMVAAVSMTAVFAWRYWRVPGLLSRTTGMFNGMTLILTAVVVVSGALHGTLRHSVADLTQGSPLSSAPDRSSKPRFGPDIYLILLDGYARDDVLRKRFAFDNSQFLRELEARDFEVAELSHSNYLFTEQTLSSMFHMALLHEIPALAPVISGEAPLEPAARRALTDNPAFAILRQQGYAVVTYALPYEGVSIRQADVYIDAPELNEFEWQLVSRSFLLDLIDAVAPDFFADQRRQRIEDELQHAVEVAQTERLGPRFLFAHVLAPHTPLVFGPNGEALPLAAKRRTIDTAAGLGLTDTQFAERFAGQTMYVNRRTLEVIDAIRAAAAEPPVIIVMSDHGSRSQELDVSNATPDELRERFGTLFAASTPGRRNLFPVDVTPAEVLGRLFEAYFERPFIEPADGIFASLGSNPFDTLRLPVQALLERADE